MKQQARLKDLSIRGELQPSYALIHIVAGIHDSGSFVWLHLASAQRGMQKYNRLTLEQQTLKLSAGEPKIKQRAIIADAAHEGSLHWVLRAPEGIGAAGRQRATLFLGRFICVHKLWRGASFDEDVNLRRNLFPACVSLW